MNNQQAEIYTKAVNYMADAVRAKPAILYGANGKPLLPSIPFQPESAASRRSGAMKNWNPRRMFSKQQESITREQVQLRSADLIENDPHGAGIADTFATTVIGAGLQPHPSVDPELLGGDKDRANAIKKQMRRNWQVWGAMAGAGLPKHIGDIEFLLEKSMVKYGEYFVLLPMLDDPFRPFSLACQVIHPARVKTPIDLQNDPRVRDGVRLGPYGDPVGYYIQRTPQNGLLFIGQTSKDFLYVKTRVGHRYRVLHGFSCTDPEAVRGMPLLAPGMPMFKKFHDLLDQELVSLLVTAAFSMFIEVGEGADPLAWANQMANIPGATNRTPTGEQPRYEEMIPGSIMYGALGQKPHLLKPDRPGRTFDPFAKLLKKGIAHGTGIPYPVLFKDLDGLNFAGFRGAMLEAWRVYRHRRIVRGRGFNQPLFTMLQEEAWLTDRLDYGDFYSDMLPLTLSQWRGAPKGDTEPIKQAKADILLVDANMKTKEQAAAEHSDGEDLVDIFDQRQEEVEMEEARGISTSALNEPIKAKPVKTVAGNE